MPIKRWARLLHKPRLSKLKRKLWKLKPALLPTQSNEKRSSRRSKRLKRMPRMISRKRRRPKKNSRRENKTPRKKSKRSKRTRLMRNKSVSRNQRKRSRSSIAILRRLVPTVRPWRMLHKLLLALRARKTLALNSTQLSPLRRKSLRTLWLWPRRLLLTSRLQLNRLPRLSRLHRRARQMLPQRLPKTRKP